MAEQKKTPQHGRKNDQKMKPYLVYCYLMRKTDANHFESAEDIKAYLEECGIHAERRSIYRDIDEINKAILMTTMDAYGLPKASTIEEAEELLKDENQKTIVYDKHEKGFYVRKRHYKVDDIRFLAECVRTAKFIDERRSKRLINVVCDLTSEHIAEELQNDAYLLDRNKFGMTCRPHLGRTSPATGSDVRIPKQVRNDDCLNGPLSCRRTQSAGKPAYLR